MKRIKINSIVCASFLLVGSVEFAMAMVHEYLSSRPEKEEPDYVNIYHSDTHESPSAAEINAMTERSNDTQSQQVLKSQLNESNLTTKNDAITLEIAPTENQKVAYQKSPIEKLPDNIIKNSMQSIREALKANNSSWFGSSKAPEDLLEKYKENPKKNKNNIVVLQYLIDQKKNASEIFTQNKNVITNNDIDTIKSSLDENDFDFTNGLTIYHDSMYKNKVIIDANRTIVYSSNPDTRNNIATRIETDNPGILTTRAKNIIENVNCTVTQKDGIVSYQSQDRRLKPIQINITTGKIIPSNDNDSPLNIRGKHELPQASTPASNVNLKPQASRSESLTKTAVASANQNANNMPENVLTPVKIKSESLNEPLINVYSIAPKKYTVEPAEQTPTKKINSKNWATAAKAQADANTQTFHDFMSLPNDITIPTKNNSEVKTEKAPSTLQDYVTTTFTALYQRGAVTASSIKAAVMSIFRTTKSNLPMGKEAEIAGDIAQDALAIKDNQTWTDWITKSTQKISDAIFGTPKSTAELQAKMVDTIYNITNINAKQLESRLNVSMSVKLIKDTILDTVLPNLDVNKKAAIKKSILINPTDWTNDNNQFDPVKFKAWIDATVQDIQDQVAMNSPIDAHYALVD